jgi:DNA-binding transcriptional LysR family regulator
MGMDRLRKVSNAWNWLPAFRVVAEYESLQKAAVALSVSPSALSRTVRLLEDAVGEPLFVRSTSGLTLTAFGEELLKGTRDAMRRIDDVIAAAGNAPANTRVFSVAAGGAVLPRLLDGALAAILGGDRVRVDGGRADVRYRMSLVPDDDVVAELLRGNIDVALVDGGWSLEPPNEISARRVGEVAFSLMAPPGHRLHASGAADDALDGERVVILDGFAAGERSTGDVVAIATSMESAERLAMHGPFLAVLPAAFASAGFTIVAPLPTTMSVLALYRTPLEKEPTPLVTALLGALAAVMTVRP